MTGLARGVSPSVIDISEYYFSKTFLLGSWLPSPKPLVRIRSFNTLPDKKLMALRRLNGKQQYK